MLFALFFHSPSRRFFAPALQANEFAQYSFTLHNKVVVAEKLGSILQFHRKDFDKPADFTADNDESTTAHVEYNAK